MADMKRPITVLTLVRDILVEANKWRARGKPKKQDNNPGPVLRSGSQQDPELSPNPIKPSATPEAQAHAVGPQSGSPFKLSNFLALLKDTFADWNSDKAPQLAAALAYYAIFSIAPLLIVVIAIVGLAFGQQAAQNQIVGQIKGLVGDQGAVVIQDMIKGANKPSTGIIATIIGLVTLLLGAAGAFGQMKSALNIIWNVPPQQVSGLAGIINSIKNEFISLGMVLGIGFLLLVSLVVSAAIAGISNFVGGYMTLPPIVWHLVDFVVSFAVITLLFAAIYKVLPDVEIDWNDVWIGAGITALLFTIGKLLIGLYLGHSGVASAYGAAGSLVVLLLWIYYSAQILFFGAEFTQVYANRYGSRIVYRSLALAQQQKPSQQQAARA